MISLSDVSFRYPRSRSRALEHFTLRVEKGEFVVLFGPSGAGKTTLFDLLIATRIPEDGEISVGPHSWSQRNKVDRAVLRRSLGMVFEDFRLLQERTVSENIALPLELDGKHSSRAIREQTLKTLERFGLADIGAQYPSELSMGERQKAAIARAVITEPLVLLLDEPTAQLDIESAREVLEHLRREHRRGMTVILGTSDLRIAEMLPETRRVDLEPIVSAV